MKQILADLERGHGGYISLCLSRETQQQEVLGTAVDTLWPVQQEGVGQSLAAAMLGFTPCRQVLTSHRDGAEALLPVVVPAECQSSCCPSSPIIAQHWFMQRLGGRFEGLTRAELVLNSRAEPFAHWAPCRQERGPQQCWLRFPSAGSQVEMLVRKAFWVVLDFPSADRELGWDKCDLTGKGMRALWRSPSQKGCLPGWPGCNASSRPL